MKAAHGLVRLTARSTAGEPMAKNRSRQQKRRQKGTYRSHLLTGDPEQRRFGPMMSDILGLPTVSGPKDRERAWAYFDQFNTFEQWVLDGGPPRHAPGAQTTPEHLFMIERWPEAFEVYRESMWSYLERELQLNPWTATLRSLLQRAKATDPVGYPDLMEEVDRGLDRYWQQLRNASHAQRDIQASATEHQKLRASLRTYTELFEIDFGLWFLGVLGRCYGEGKIRTQLFGGSSTNVAQGSLIDQVSTSIAGTPLQPLLSSALDPELRNVIGHNDYRIEDQSDEYFLISLRDGRSWTGEEVFWKVLSAGQFADSVHTVLAYEREISSNDVGEFAGVGIVAVSYILTEEQPIVVLFQLWCFHRLDDRGEWLDATSMVIESDLDGEEEVVRFNDVAWSKGSRVSTTEIGSALAAAGWVKVIRVPVVPDIGIGQPGFTRPDGANYCVFGEADVHVIPFAGVTSQA